MPLSHIHHHAAKYIVTYLIQIPERSTTERSKIHTQYHTNILSSGIVDNTSLQTFRHLVDKPSNNAILDLSHQQVKLLIPEFFHVHFHFCVGGFDFLSLVGFGIGSEPLRCLAPQPTLGHHVLHAG